MNIDEEVVGEMLRNPHTLLALSDAGAHATLLCEAGQTSYFLGEWVRERRLMSLEEAVRRITSLPAEVFGLHDRGRLAPGFAADLVIFDPSTIAAEVAEVVRDLPGGEPRYVQRARGIAWTFVNGRPVIQEGRIPQGLEGIGPGVIARPGII
jgi:N-acyl-D-aspartate/D-glutamate deacylase